MRDELSALGYKAGRPSLNSSHSNARNYFINLGTGNFKDLLDERQRAL